VSQATRYNIFVPLASGIQKIDDATPDGLSSASELIMAIALHLKFSQEGVISSSYNDAHNLLAKTTSGYVFLELLQQQSYPHLAIRNIATIDIPKYSDFGDLFRYAREITVYVESHSLQQRFFSDRENTHIFLSYLDDSHYRSSVRYIKTTIMLSVKIATDYLIPAITGILD